MAFFSVQKEAMQQCQAAIAKQQAFTLHLLRGRPSSLKTRKLVIAHFKSAATEHLNSAAPLVGVPGQVQWKSGEAGHLYFVTVQKDEPDVRYEHHIHLCFQARMSDESQLAPHPRL